MIENALKSPAIIHFSSDTKPWNNADLPFAKMFKQYAKGTNFYNEIIFTNLLEMFTKKDKTKFYSTPYQYIFSLKNLNKSRKNHKIITILGIKIKLKRKSCQNGISSNSQSDKH